MIRAQTFYSSLTLVGVFFLWLSYKSDSAPAFIGISILTASSLLAIAVSQTRSDSTDANSFVRFKNELEKGSLTRKELGSKVGRLSEWDDELSQHISYLSPGQEEALNRLIYEGKLLESDGKLSLPASENLPSSFS